MTQTEVETYTLRRQTRQALLACCASLVMLSGCTKSSQGTINPLTDYSEASPYAEFGCSVHANDGSCLKATCKADEKGNCNDWAAGCLKNDGYLQGSSDSATCAKIL